MSIKGKLAFITGAGRGIGREIAMLFASNGSDLAICDVDAGLVAETGKDIEAATGRKVITGKVDVTAFEEVEGTCQQCRHNQR